MKSILMLCLLTLAPVASGQVVFVGKQPDKDWCYKAETIQPNLVLTEQEHVFGRIFVAATGMTPETRGTSLVQANRAAGNAFRDEVANLLKAAGRDVEKEVSKPTPFGRRVVDLEVKHNGKTLGGIETKRGKSPYKPSQRAKDAYLKRQGYPVNVVRKP